MPSVVAQMHEFCSSKGKNEATFSEKTKMFSNNLSSLHTYFGILTKWLLFFCSTPLLSFLIRNLPGNKREALYSDHVGLREI